MRRILQSAFVPPNSFFELGVGLKYPTGTYYNFLERGVYITVAVSTEDDPKPSPLDEPDWI